ncbi:DnaJ domain-containing protein [Nostocaceae cyanobacterium CENA357]|uniref:DnaJ domain-containing protein n=1 Tax=Atlanticothrix silvestris CENA357 TaxID=1725252 RepID=A0A8J7L583_9CYAN|nr:DnaJ domain-containing protein [Atlanticothrix silvestris]MBH8552802.1 DnaJ domain-containing protein [Atlanticothrix silvestris CENA357]
MSQTAFPAKWLKQLSDPYAVLGVSVVANEEQILKRYRILVKLLHPDRYAKNNNVEQKLVTAIFTCLINPAYEQLKRTQKRANVIVQLRIEAKSWQHKASSLQNPVVEQLMPMSALEAQVFYEQAIASYAEDQYQLLHQAYQITQHLSNLNLAYLCLQTSNSFISKAPISVVSKVKCQPLELTLDKITNVKPVPTNYAQRHYQRAIQYTQQGNWALAVGELRDAIKLEPNNADYYALLGLVHLRQNFSGMARVYTRQALKINPQQPLALKYATQLKINLNENTNPQTMVKALGIAALLSRFVFKTEANSSQVLKSR